tara:strand:+ start:366 stop:602 length:237 start_codon:yes stop_codon:yes gene_type:complete
MLKKQNIIGEIKKIIGKIPINEKSNLIDSGFLDSMNLIRMVSVLEKKFKIKISSYELSNKKNFSVNGICLLVSKLSKS